MSTTPTAPIWQDETTSLAVWVNGGLIEITMADGWSGRCLPSEVATIGAQLASAIAEATAWAERWDITTGGYRDAA